MTTRYYAHNRGGFDPASNTVYIEATKEFGFAWKDDGTASAYTKVYDIESCGKLVNSGHWKEISLSEASVMLDDAIAQRAQRLRQISALAVRDIPETPIEAW